MGPVTASLSFLPLTQNIAMPAQSRVTGLDSDPWLSHSPRQRPAQSEEH